MLECMLSDCNWVNQAQLKQPWSLCLPLSHCIELWLDHEVSKIEQLAPFLVFTGVAGDENACTVTCCELSLLDDSKTAWENIDAIINRLELKPVSAEVLFSAQFLDKEVSWCILHCTHNRMHSKTQICYWFKVSMYGSHFLLHLKLNINVYWPCMWV